MTIRMYQITLTPAGSAGAATANAQTFEPVNGYLVGVHLNYTSQPATTDVTIATVAVPVTILTISNANTDAWFYPKHVVHGEAGVALTGTSGGDRTYIPVADYIKVTIAEGDPVANGLIATLLVEC